MARLVDEGHSSIVTTVTCVLAKKSVLDAFNRGHTTSEPLLWSHYIGYRPCALPRDNLQ